MLEVGLKLTVPGRLGPYELVALLGSGGMGEVYRARDPRLRRDVAVKVLPDAAAGDPGRQRRFTLEAQAAGALNHPNIVAVYDVGAEDGVQYFVSELVEGFTLRQELQRGPLPIKRLIDLAAQIADGLAAAHESGLVHRDLKPENVMVTPAGRAKILDFGLAKASAAEAGDVSVTQSAAGLIVGTAPYMSPEQARGVAVDFRSDQFSFGAMLYEMATGIQAFKRDTAVQTLSAVLDAEPRPAADINPAVPVPLRWVVERCLRKTAEERYASTADLARDLRTLRDRLSELGVALPSADVAVAPTRRRWWLAASVAAGASLLAGWGATRQLHPARVDLSDYRFTSLATDAGYQGAPAWSPDGKALAYVAEVNGVLQVFTRTVGSPLRTQITRALHDCTDPFWSNDGSRMYFHSLAGTRVSLFSVDTAGGAPELLLENASSATMSPDGRALVFLRQTDDSPTALTLWTSAANGSSARRYARGPFAGENTMAAGVAKFAPDGKKLLVWTWWTSVTGNQKDLWLIPWPEGDPQEVDSGRVSQPVSALPFSWLPDSQHIIMVVDRDLTPGRHLWLFDLRGTALRQVTASTGNESAPAVAPDGRSIAFTQEDSDFDVLLVPLDGSPPRPVLVTTRNELDPAWSARDRQFAYVSDRTGNQQIWLRSQDGQWERPLVTDANFTEPSRYFGALSFSPDGQRLAYQRQNAAGFFHLFISAIGGGRAARIAPGDEFQNAPTWSPDGSWIAFASTGGLRKVRVGGTATPVLLNADVHGLSRPTWSPDGKWIAIQDATKGLVLVDADDGRVRVAEEGESMWHAYAWGVDGSTLYGLKGSDDEPNRYVFAALDIASGKTREVGRPIGTIPLANDPIRGFAFVPGEGFVTSIAHVRSDLWMLEGFEPPRRAWLERWFGWFQ